MIGGPPVEAETASVAGDDVERLAAQDHEVAGDRRNDFLKRESEARRSESTPTARFAGLSNQIDSNPTNSITVVATSIAWRVQKRTRVSSYRAKTICVSALRTVRSTTKPAIKISVNRKF